MSFEAKERFFFKIAKISAFWMNIVVQSVLAIIQSIMDLIEKFQCLLLTEPERTFRKAGITDEHGLTQEGQAIFLAYLLGEYGDDFKREVVDLLVSKKPSE